MLHDLLKATKLTVPFMSCYTCQLSCIMRESHACGSKIVISCIQTNFSRLTDTSECNCLCSRSHSSFRNSLIMLEIGWKSFGNRQRDLFWSRRKSFYTFGYPQKLSESLRKSSEIFGNLRKSFENFNNLPKPSVKLRKFSSVGTKNLTHFTEKKLAGISCELPKQMPYTTRKTWSTNSMTSTLSASHFTSESAKNAAKISWKLICTWLVSFFNLYLEV